jgi:hypothetical protein
MVAKQYNMKLNGTYYNRQQSGRGTNLVLGVRITPRNDWNVGEIGRRIGRDIRIQCMFWILLCEILHQKMLLLLLVVIFVVMFLCFLLRALYVDSRQPVQSKRIEIVLQ